MPSRCSPVAPQQLPHTLSGSFQTFYGRPSLYYVRKLPDNTLGAGQTACEDPSRAIAFVRDNASELGIDGGLSGYSIWGGSAGARMADWVGTSDGIANWRTMQARIEQIQANGTPATIEVFDGLSHGFGLGTGMVVEGWIDRAADFWDEQS